LNTLSNQGAHSFFHSTMSFQIGEPCTTQLVTIYELRNDIRCLKQQLFELTQKIEMMCNDDDLNNKIKQLITENDVRLNN